MLHPRGSAQHSERRIQLPDLTRGIGDELHAFRRAHRESLRRAHRVAEQDIPFRLRRSSDDRPIVSPKINPIVTAALEKPFILFSNACFPLHTAKTPDRADFFGRLII